MLREALGANDPRVAAELSTFANVRLTLADFNGARSKFEEALTIETAAYGKGDPRTVDPLLGLANIDMVLGRLEKSRAEITSAIDITRASEGDSAPDLIDELALRASVLTMMGDGISARKDLEQSLDLGERLLQVRRLGRKHGGVAHRLSHAEVVVRHDKKRALELAHLAREDFMQSERDPDARAVRAEITPWLASLGVTL